jgi:methionyl-tRNA formyltransferase
MNIIFMGTPDFAVPCLQSLIDNKHNIMAVFTKPDKPKGRGLTLTPPPVKELAVAHNIEVFQPTSLKEQEVVDLVKSFNPELIVVVAFGKILPLSILEIPQKGCINVHASLLPKYRGAGPIQWSVLNGEKVTGVTTMYMEEGLDTGDIILKKEIEILENETASELHDRLSVLGAEALIETIDLLETNSAQRQKQDDKLSCYAPMLTKELCKIDFTKSKQEVHNLIRGLSTWPCANTMLDNKLLKVYKSQIIFDKDGKSGELLDEKRFIVGCADGAVEFLQVQYEGSKKMSGEDFLRGKKFLKEQKIG